MFGRGRVTTYVILGMGERRELIEEGCRRAIEMGVYPFVVPLRPVHRVADGRTTTPPEPDYVAAVYRSVSAMLAECGPEPRRRGRRVRALPGLLRPLGVGARVPTGGAA